MSDQIADRTIKRQELPTSLGGIRYASKYAAYSIKTDTMPTKIPTNFRANRFPDAKEIVNKSAIPTSSTATFIYLRLLGFILAGERPESCQRCWGLRQHGGPAFKRRLAKMGYNAFAC